MSSRTLHLLCLLGLLLAVGLHFARGQRYGFQTQWDDGIFLRDNKHLELTWENFKYYAREPYRQLYTPLPMYSLAVDKALFGLNPLGFHLHNLLLHLASTALLFCILRHLGLSPILSTLAALLWAVNPQKNESVYWIVERKDVLCGVFVFASILAFLQALDAARAWPRALWGALAALAGVLSLGCKPFGMPLFGVYALFLAHRAWTAPDRRDALRRLWPLAAVPLLLLAATLWVTHITRQSQLALKTPGHFVDSLLVPLHNLMWYPGTAIVPTNGVNPIYPTVGPASEHWLLFLGAPLLLLALVLSAHFLRRHSWTAICLGLLMLGGMLLPVLGFWEYTAFQYCDRYNYVASAFAVALAALALPDRRPAWCVVGAAVAVMAVFAHLHAHAWDSTRALWLECIRQSDRINVKTFEIGFTEAVERAQYENEQMEPAAVDAIRQGGLKDLQFLAAKLEQHLREYPAPHAENTLLLIHAFIARNQGDHHIYRRLVETLYQRDPNPDDRAAMPFLRGSNYRRVYRQFTRQLRRRDKPSPFQPPSQNVLH